MKKALSLENFMQGLKRRTPGENEYHQAVAEVMEHLIPYVKGKPEYREAQILERLVVPDRVIGFRVCWEDDKGQVRTNHGYRVQFNNAIGPYKGGLRFHRDLTLSILKFLGFEQTFKNSLTSLPLGAAKGGADFNPVGKSDGEVMRFCQAFMTELHRYLGPEHDVPAGDGGVGSREIGFLFGQYKRLTHRFEGALTGKPLAIGGSEVRTEATGYGCAYFMRRMLQEKDEAVEGRRCVISGSGNVAMHCAEKLMDWGAQVMTLSDTSGFVYAADGLQSEQLCELKQWKLEQRRSFADLDGKFGVTFHSNQKPWRIKCELAFPCATQNELDASDAEVLVSNGCTAVAEGANMPVDSGGMAVFRESGVRFAPGKAANAGGVAVSGLEMSQNRQGLVWTSSDVEQHLERIMEEIHDRCAEHGVAQGGRIDYAKGANVAGFIKVADAMLACGVL